MVHDVAQFIRVPSYHIALILYEGRVERRLSTEPFPLFPGEKLIKFVKSDSTKEIESSSPCLPPSPKVAFLAPELTLPEKATGSTVSKIKFVSDQDIPDQIVDLKEKIKADLKSDLEILEIMESQMTSLKFNYPDLAKLLKISVSVCSKKFKKSSVSMATSGDWQM